MRHYAPLALAFGLLVLVQSDITRAQIPAFSGAEGAGAFATGGRPNAEYGGVVYHVTNLDPDPTGTTPGSLRYGLKNENFWVQPNDWPLPFWTPDINNPSTFEVVPRIIVFDVGGVIDLSATGDVDITPMNVTIAGQTAPGGITLYGAEFNPGSKDQWTDPLFPVEDHKTGNIVLRNISVRTHDQNEKDGLWFPATNSIADHVSLSWYTDEGLSITDAAFDVTVQHSIIGPGWNVNPPDDGDGSQLEGSTDHGKISVHHNLYIHNDARNPRLGEKIGNGVDVDFRNNVIYNWDQNYAGYSGSGEPSFTNFVNNYYIGGADNDGNDQIFDSADSLTRIYQSGNLLDRDFDGTADGVDHGWGVFGGSETQLSSPLSIPHGVTETPDEALETIINYAGANWQNRHFLDQRSIDQLQSYGQGTTSQTGEILQTLDPNDITAVQNIPMQTRAAGWDTDGDGMPNHWETERGLNPNVADWDGDDDTDGYLNIEEYFNELAEWPAPDEIVFDNTTARYADITNWGITRPSPGEAATTTNWQPSRFDVAVIDNGTVAMDAPGQHAGTIRLGSNSGDNATLNITAGWLEVEDETIGPGDGSIIIGSDPNATAAVNLSGGKLIAKSIMKGAGGSFNFTGGVLSAEEVHFDLSNNGGTIAPGNSPGTTHILGDLDITSGDLAIEIAGDQAGEFDKLIVDNLLTAGGTLSVSLIDGYLPVDGHTFDILDFGSISGTFAVDLPPLYGYHSWDDSQLYTTGELQITTSATLTGDFNLDGYVDGLDLLFWQTNPSVGDIEEWYVGYGYVPPAPLANATTIPEPTTATLLGLAVVGLLHRSRLSDR